MEKKTSDINTSLLAYTIPAIHERNTLQPSVAVKLHCNYPCQLHNHGSPKLSDVARALSNIANAHA